MPYIVMLFGMQGFCAHWQSQLVSHWALFHPIMSGKVEKIFSCLSSNLLRQLSNANDTKVNVPLAGKQTGFHGIGACDVEKGGTHESSDGNASIFRGISRVRAFYRDLDTLPDTEGVFSKLLVHLGIRIFDMFDQKENMSI